MMNPLVNSIGLALLASLLTFAMASFWYWRTGQRQKNELIAVVEARTQDRIKELEMKLIALTSTVTPLSAAMQAVFIKELTHFHTPELDELLVKVETDTLPEEEEPRLFVLLQERAHELNGTIPESERDVATMFPMMMKRVKAEKQAVAVELQVVSLTPPTPEEKTP